MTEGSGCPVGTTAQPLATRRISTVDEGYAAPVGCSPQAKVPVDIERCPDRATGDD